jgi:hypothetical protein
VTAGCTIASHKELAGGPLERDLACQGLIGLYRSNKRRRTNGEEGGDERRAAKGLRMTDHASTVESFSSRELS